MSADEAFISFARNVLVLEKARRYEALIATPRGRKKFLGCLYHDFDDAILPACERGNDYMAILGFACFVFFEPEGFGAAFASVENAYNKLSDRDGWLILTDDGSAGVYRPENRWDAERMIERR